MTTDEIIKFERQRRLEAMQALQTCKWCRTFGSHYCPHFIAKGDSVRPEALASEIIGGEHESYG